MTKRFFIMIMAVVMVLSGALTVAPAIAEGVSFLPPPDPLIDNNQGDGESETITSFAGLLDRINGALNVFVPFLIGIGVFIVIYGVFGYIRHADDEEKRKEAKLFMVWGVVGVFIMVSIWGLVSILVNTFEFRRNAPSVESVFPTGEYE